MKQDICKVWKISSDEYFLLDAELGALAEYQAWDLIKRNAKSNFTDDQSDIAQNLRIAMLKAGSYYKRQVYIEKCLSLCKKHIDDEFNKKIIDSLEDLWKNKTRHGAHKQKFGPDQEKILYKMVRKFVPKKERPDKNAKLVLNSEFLNYCKSVTWNEQKAMGKKITREKAIRSNQVSLSEYDYLSGAV